jgi:metacaspase-1
MAKSPAKSKRKAHSLNIGLNGVSAAQYGGWDGELEACEFDAKDMAAIAKASGMKSTKLLTKKATRSAVLSTIRKSASQMKDGDFFFLTYSGHGGQVPDLNGDEPDKKDETWCLYGELIDDELYVELSRFASGVRVLVLSDSCHSGTVTRDVLDTASAARPGRSKMMPPSVALRTYQEHKAFYDKLQKDLSQAAKKGSASNPDDALAHLAASHDKPRFAGQCKAEVILISGCQDNQTSMDGNHNGAFTEQLLLVWNHGTYRGNYAKFHAAIKARMPASQSPNLFTLARRQIL